MAVILTIPLSVNEMALAQWRFCVQINTLIAIFLTLGRLAVMLTLAEGMGQLKLNIFKLFKGKEGRLNHLRPCDDSGQGPCGALMYFVEIRKDISKLASRGAALTILALVFDPFTQQILHYPLR